MSKTTVPEEITELLRIHDPQKHVAHVWRHSPQCLTTLVVSQNHHVERLRWNLGDSGRWTMIPVSQGWLDGEL